MAMPADFRLMYLISGIVLIEVYCIIPVIRTLINTKCVKLLWARYFRINILIFYMVIYQY